MSPVLKHKHCLIAFNYAESPSMSRHILTMWHVAGTVLSNVNGSLNG